MEGGAFIPLVVSCGLAAAIIGKIKGSSFFLWFLIGACTLGIGILAALVHRVERNEPERRCPTCGKWVKLSDQVCMRCGEDLDWVEPRLEEPLAPGALR
jgi:hypothetical protein